MSILRGKDMNTAERKPVVFRSTNWRSAALGTSTTDREV